jgi:GAF domain-containing protein
VTIDERVRTDPSRGDRFFGDDLPLELGPRRAAKIYLARLLTVIGAGSAVLGLSALGAFTDFAPVLAAWTGLLILITVWALWRDMGRSPGGRAARWRARFLFPSMFSLFTITAVASASLATVSERPTRVTLVVVCVIAILSDFLLGKVTLIRAEVAADKTVEQALQGVALTRTAQPLITVLGDVVAAKSDTERRNAMDVLMRLTVGIARTVCGQSLDRRTETRATFYELESDTRVVKRAYEGSPGAKPPRDAFDGSKSINEKRVIELAKGDRALVVNDLDAAPPEFFSDYRGRPYKSYIAVPVRAGERAFGVLMIDSSMPNSLTDVDVGYAILLAGILGSGLAAAETSEPRIELGATDEGLLDEVARSFDVVFAQELPPRPVSFSLIPGADQKVLRLLHEGTDDVIALEEYRKAIAKLAADRAERGRRRLNVLSGKLIWAESTDPAYKIRIYEGYASH